MSTRRIVQGLAGVLLAVVMVLGMGGAPAQSAAPLTVPGYYGYPYFFITDVVKDTSVTIAPYNFPPNDTFIVRMNYYGTYGLGGVVVDTVTTDANGTLSKTTFSIPAGLAGQYRIAIRLESQTSGYYAYNWFYNNSTNVTPTPAPTATPNPLAGYRGYPYFYISSVVKGNTVTIKPHNFTPNDTYVVRMNYYGSYGIGGTVVDTVTTDANGNLSKTTFNIPANLAGLSRIAIRLESPNTGYYAYNWFYNTTATVAVP